MQGLNKHIYNIGPDNNEISIHELAEWVIALTDKNPRIEWVPDRPREVKNAYCSSSKIKKEFNYNAKIPLESTLSQMIEWIRVRGPAKFNYHLPIEIDHSYELPRTWKERLF